MSIKEKNNNHHRKSIRLKEYDYSQGAYYFVTICSKDTRNLFGEISQGFMKLNKFGTMIEEEILRIQERFVNCGVDYFVIMPNHLHLILKIDESRGEVTSPKGDISENIGEVPSPLPSLGSIIAYLKYQTTKKINEIQKSPGRKIFQRNYYEHIIRNERELFEFRRYIENNPMNWEEDELHS